MNNKTLLIIGICLAGMVSLPLQASARGKKKSSPSESASPAAADAASPAKSNPRPIPFHGMATSVDQNAKTFIIAGKEKSRVFKVTENTKVTKAGNPVTMTDITENTEISGSYWKRDDDSLEAKTVKIGPAVEKKGKKKEKGTSSESPAASPTASPKP